MKNKKFGIVWYAGSLLIDHLFAMLMSIAVTNVINFFSDDGIPILSFIIRFSVYFAICYVDSWQRGDADNNRMRLGIIPNNMYRGFLAGCVASIPGLVLAIPAFLAECGIVSFYDVFGVDLFTTLNRFWQLPIGGLYVFANELPLLNFAFLLILPVFAEIGYVMGVKRIALKQIFLYRNAEDE